VFTRWGFGQEIRDDAPMSHQRKRGTPTMGGLAILTAIWASYLGTNLVGLAFGGEGPSASGLLVLGLATALGVVGFTDDYVKLRRSRNLGLNKRAKSAGQLVAAVLFGVLALQFRNSDGLTPGGAELSYVREIAGLTLAPVVFVLFCIVVVSAWSNAVNLTDGLDGLAAGAMAMVAAAYVLITFWQFRNACAVTPGAGCYHVRDPLDLAFIAAATAGACIGFLWWNAAPAKIIMGDTGVACAGRHHRRAVGDQSDRGPCHHSWRTVRGRGDVGRHSGRVVPHHRPTGLPPDPAAPPLRADGLAGKHTDHSVLAHHGHHLRPRNRALLRRMVDGRRGLSG
jgi:phospho-N-acetylmuramoyl-pentapeptide-transferase